MFSTGSKKSKFSRVAMKGTQFKNCSKNESKMFHVVIFQGYEFETGQISWVEETRLMWKH